MNLGIKDFIKKICMVKNVGMCEANSNNKLCGQIWNNAKTPEFSKRNWPIAISTIRNSSLWPYTFQSCGAA